MSRLMSVAMTTDAVIERRKTVTRRKGWWTDKNGRRILHVGDTLTLCRKVQGRKPGEPIERLAEVEVISVSREPLWTLTVGNDDRDLGDRTPSSWATAEMEREGFPGLDPHVFVRKYFTDAQGIHVMDAVTRMGRSPTWRRCAVRSESTPNGGRGRSGT